MLDRGKRLKTFNLIGLNQAKDHYAKKQKKTRILVALTALLGFILFLFFIKW